MRYVLGVDLGTTAIKAAVLDEAGCILGSRTCEYVLQTPRPSWVELPAETYEMAFRSAIHEALAKAGLRPEDVDTMGLSAQGETLFFLDEHDEPLRPAIVWMDNRAVAEAQDLQEALGGREVIHRATGQVSMVATWPASKILWVRRNEPEVFARTRKFLLIEDFFIHRMTGRYMAEDSLLCSTMLWDIRTRDYWPAMLEALGIAREQLPEIHSPGTPVGHLSPEGAKRFGLSERTKVCLGALDQACGAIGVGNVRPGIFSESTGAALATVAIVDRPVFDPNGEMPCFAAGIPGTYMIHSFSTGGMAIRWFRDAFCETELAKERAGGANAYDQIDALAATAPPGSDGMLVLPHLQGAGPPDSDMSAKASFLGVTLNHTKAHFARAIMEGVAMVLLRMKQATEALGVEIEEIRSLSGGALSPVWCQIKADAAGLPVRTLKHTESAACRGAAILAGVGTGIWRDAAETATAWIENDRLYRPDPKNKPIYDRMLVEYRNRLGSLKP